MQSAIMGLRAERPWQPWPRCAENGQWVVSEVEPDTHWAGGDILRKRDGGLGPDTFWTPRVINSSWADTTSKKPFVLRALKDSILLSN